MRNLNLNKYGVFIGDVFLLNYYGILVFFQVVATTETYTYLVELKTVPCGEGIVLDKDLKTSKNPYFVLKNNIRSKTTYKVEPRYYNKEVVLPIKIDENSKIYQEAYEMYDNPIVDTFYAYKLNEYRNCCWVSEVCEDENYKVGQA